MVQGYLVIQAPEIINCSSYSEDHMNEENLQQIHKMDKNKFFINHFGIPPQHTCWAVWAINHDSIVTRNYIPQRLDVFFKNAVLRNIMQAKVNDEMGIWKVHLTIPRMKTIQNVHWGTETVHNGMKGHFNRVVHHMRKCLSLNENHLTEHKANKFAQVCKIWGVSGITKVDGMSHNIFFYLTFITI